ncbi:hypothetical protein BDN67DRAFT_434426 [Paxillus ammoniavirescens]|nr:hypothetical protein BDN67DRAFT_434426 [Paxillus ammoniavirescens]
MSSERRDILDDDNPEGERIGLKGGYEPSKWVSEKLLFEAGKGPETWCAPWHVLGSSKTVVTDTDDFIRRTVKGCVQPGLVPQHCEYGACRLRSDIQQLAILARRLWFLDTRMRVPCLAQRFKYYCAIAES